jgi:uncharacterized protein (DUF1501 family)
MRCIECEEIELARVHDARPTQMLPVPYAALDGFPAGRERSALTRRRLLQFGVAGMASVYGPKALGWDSVWESVAAEADAPTGNCLLLLYLAGGNDGLNALIPADPADYSAYVAARPVIHRGQGATAGGVVGSQPLKGSAGSQLAFANVMVSTGGGGDNGVADLGLDTLYGDGSGGAGSDLAVMPAVDALNFSLSHFDNSDLWFNGNPGGVVSTGWLGRWIDRNGSPDNPLQAISIDTALSKSIRTAKNPVCAIPSLGALGFSMNAGFASPSGTASTVDVNAQMSALASVPVGDDNLYLGRSRGTYGVAVEAFATGKSIDQTIPNTATYPAGNNTLITRLKLAARLFKAGLGTKIITIHWGGFDTHSDQLKGQDPQLRDLSTALAAFRRDLAARGIEDKVCTLIFSEFGRRVADNGSGTDHGAGGLMMAMGSGVRGGLASEWPGCETNERLNGNLKVPTDFRSVYRAVIEEWLGDDPQGVLGGSLPAQLKRGDGLTGRSLFK